MKYMHFNSACSYAGISNMLSLMGFETEDYQIIRDMKLPFFIRFDSETGRYNTGAMLQSKEWFELYLKPRGFCYKENIVPRDEAVQLLSKGTMLGIQVSETSKHAVIFLEKKDDIYVFLNNKWEESKEAEVYEFSHKELQERLPESVVLGQIEKCEKETVDLLPYFESAISTWEKIKADIGKLASQNVSPEKLKDVMRQLFRALLVDTLAMMKILEQNELVRNLEELQKQFLQTVKKNQAVCLADTMDCVMMENTLDAIISMVRSEKEIYLAGRTKGTTK